MVKSQDLNCDWKLVKLRWLGCIVVKSNYFQGEHSGYTCKMNIYLWSEYLICPIFIFHFYCKRHNQFLKSFKNRWEYTSKDWEKTFKFPTNFVYQRRKFVIEDYFTILPSAKNNYCFKVLHTNCQHWHKSNPITQNFLLRTVHILSK